MKQQVPSQALKEATALPIGKSLRHAAIKAVPEHKRISTTPMDSHFNQDFSQTTVWPSLPMVGQNYGTAACPVFPRTFPFGGACHRCPAQASVNIQPAIGERVGLNP